MSFYNLYLTTGDNKSYVKKQRLHTLELLDKNIKQSDSEKVFVGGDFNFITCELDTNHSEDFAQKSKKIGMDIEKWLNMEQELNLQDCYRNQFETRKSFTKITGSRTARRIDRFHSNSNVINYKHIPISFSDHCASPGITINGSTQIKWGNGYWKLN